MSRSRRRELDPDGLSGADMISIEGTSGNGSVLVSFSSSLRHECVPSMGMASAVPNAMVAGCEVVQMWNRVRQEQEVKTKEKGEEMKLEEMDNFIRA